LVWQPDIAADSGADAPDGQDAGQGFDPYGNGSWVWTPAGYSWASGYGWGWLPYRCGQWVYFDDFGWGWQPGVSCGTFGFGGYGFGGYGFGFNIGRAPGFWRRPKRPIPGPGPVHPIIRARSGPVPILIAQSYGSGRVIRVKTVEGRSIERLAPVASLPVPRDGSAVGSTLRRDYPVNSSTREPAFGLAATHDAPAGRMPWEPPIGSHPVPASPNYGIQGQRGAPVVRSAPAQHASPPAAASHSAPSAAPHK